jgi:hypothetical protein
MVRILLVYQAFLRPRLHRLWLHAALAAGRDPAAAWPARRLRLASGKDARRPGRSVAAWVHAVVSGFAGAAFLVSLAGE